MFARHERMLALRYLRPRREEGFLAFIGASSIAGIAVGVGTLIVVLAVMNGFPSVLMSRILTVNGDFLVYGVARTDAAADAERVAAVAGIKAAFPVIEGNVLGHTPAGAAAGIRIQGIRPEDLARHPAVATNIRQGDLAGFGGGIIIGARLAERLGIGPGDRLTLVSAAGRATALGTVPRRKTYRVAAIFELGIFDYDDSYVFMPLSQARIYLRPARAPVNLAVWLEAGADRAAATKAIAAAAVGKVFDWRPYFLERFDFVRVQRNVVVLILSLIVIVGALNLVSGLAMLVREKEADIGILRTLGMGRLQVARVFVLSSLTVGVTGTVLGLLLGLAFADNIETLRQWLGAATGIDLFSAEIYSLDAVPVDLRLVDITLVAAGTVVLAFLATLLPSWRAARIDPIEALRHG